MADEIVIYHNPRCSKSRQTLQLLQDRDEPFQVIEYLNDPLSAEEIQNVAMLLDMHPHDLVRTKEDEYARAGIGPDSSELEVAAAIAEYPRLMERPIVVKGDKAAIGRPPESVLEILD